MAYNMLQKQFLIGRRLCGTQTDSRGCSEKRRMAPYGTSFEAAPAVKALSKRNILVVQTAPASGSRSQARLRSPRLNPVGPRVQRAPFRVERAHARTARNKRAAKSMKTNDLAKSLISRPNDFNKLHHPKRNPSFRSAQYSFRFGAFGLRGRQKRNGPRRLAATRAARASKAVGACRNGCSRSALAVVETRESLDLGSRAFFRKRGRLAGSRPKKVAQKSSQVHEIIGARNFVRGARPGRGEPRRSA